uniref:Uncharacterized protein n=1 Tax=Desulfovibrio sp. U5L TaxID=596152 RepID=I2PZY6_9BACT
MTLPTADDVFGPATAALPSADDVFGPSDLPTADDVFGKERNAALRTLDTLAEASGKVTEGVKAGGKEAARGPPVGEGFFWGSYLSG